MGGSGGGYYSGSSDPVKLAEEIRTAEASSANAAFEAEVGSLLNRMLVQYNDRDTDAVNHHLQAISNALAQEIDGTVDLRFGGSVAKHTYVDGLSDIDSLVILNESELQDLSPSEVKEYFKARLEERFPNTQIRVGTLAVTVSFSDIEIQLLPAIKTRTGFRIPDATGDGWSHIKPQEFASTLTRINQSQGNKVVSTIKLAKAIIANLPENRQMSGYHVEAIAVQLFSDYQGAKTPKAMLAHFFEQASMRIQKPLIDITGQSEHVDTYLGAEGSLQRQLVADSLGRISRKMKNADASQLLPQWSELFGE